MLRYFLLLCGTLILWQAMSAKDLGVVNDTTYLTFLLCPGVTTVDYAGETLSLGQTKVFHLIGEMSADSIVKATVKQAPVVDFWATAEPICKGSNDGVIEFYDNVGITAPYEFSIDGGATFSDLYTREGLSAGHYELRAKDRLGCIYEYELDIPEAPPLKVENPSRVVTCLDSVALTFSITGRPNMPYTWQWHWDDEPGITSDSVVWAKTPGTYRLTVANACETVERAIDVEFKDEPVAVQFYVPDSFSPNSDGINDCFGAFTSPDAQLLDYQFLIFDQWGNQVFEANNLEDCWDGSFRGKEMDTAVFAWFISAKILDCAGETLSIIQKGGAAIVR